MGRSKEEFIEATGGFQLDNPLSFTPQHGLIIQALETKLKSGTLSFDEVEEVRQQLCKLKGLRPDEWDYDDDDD